MNYIFEKVIIDTLQDKKIKLYQYSHGGDAIVYQIQKSNWHGSAVKFVKKITGFIKDVRITEKGNIKMYVDIDGVVHKIQAKLSTQIEIGELNDFDKINLETVNALDGIYRITKDTWVEIFGHEPKPVGNITLRYFETPNSSPEYLEGYYDEKSKQYKIGDKLIDQNKITHYIILSEPKKIHLMEPVY